MRRKQNMIFDDAVMSDVITAPLHYVIADLRERLNSIIFKDEAIIADGCARKDSGS